MTENEKTIVNVFKDFGENINLDSKIDDLNLDSLDVLDYVENARIKLA